MHVKVHAIKMKAIFYYLTFFLIVIFECNCQYYRDADEYEQSHKLIFPTSSQSQYQQYPVPNLHDGLQFSSLRTKSLSFQTQLNENHDQTTDDMISRNIFQLGQEILKKMMAKQKLKSFVLSPTSIASALSLLLLGSNGQTYQELKRIFDLNNSGIFNSEPYKFHKEFSLLIEDLVATVGTMKRMRPQTQWRLSPAKNSLNLRIGGQSYPDIDSLSPSEYHQVRIANGIFVQNGFSLRREYETVVKNAYQSEILPLDFHGNSEAAKKFINNWVDEKTHGKIKEIISEDIAPDTNVIMTSALYFKAYWETPFFSSLLNYDFYPNGFDKPAIRVGMMPNGGIFPHYDAKEYGCEILGLPYKGNVSTMYIIQPYNSSAEKLLEFQASLTADHIENMISKMIRKSAILVIPKMHLTSTVNLKKIFMELGLQSLFAKDESDLSLIVDGSPQNNVKNDQQHLTRVPIYGTQTNRDPLYYTQFEGMNRNQSFTRNYMNSNRKKRAVTYKVESLFRPEVEPLRLKDFILNKRITKHNPGKKLSRSRRQLNEFSNNNIKFLDSIRNKVGLQNPHLYVEEIIHKVDLIVNHKGTEGGAATSLHLKRSGPDVVFRAETPFLFLIRHDLTKFPLFYGAVYEPTNF